MCVCLRERQTDRERWGRKSDTYLFICMEAKVGSGCLPFLLSTLFVCLFVCFLIFGIRFLTAPELTHTSGQRAYGDSPVSASPSLGL